MALWLGWHSAAPASTFEESPFKTFMAELATTSSTTGPVALKVLHPELAATRLDVSFRFEGT